MSDQVNSLSVRGLPPKLLVEKERPTRQGRSSAATPPRPPASPLGLRRPKPRVSLFVPRNGPGSRQAGMATDTGPPPP